MAPWLFGKSSSQAAVPPPPPPPPQETMQQQIRKNQRSIDKACRELDRERMKMEAQERSIKIQIKKLAKQGQVEAARIMAKDLVRVRNHITRTYQMRTQLQSVSMQLSTMRTNEAMAGAMGNAVKIMARMNKSLNLPAMQQVLMNFEMEHGKMEMTQEMMDDAMGDALAGPDEEELSEEILNQVMDELGLEGSQQMNSAAAGNAQPVANDPQHDQAIQSRLDALR